MPNSSKIYASTVADVRSNRMLSGEKLRRIADADFASAVKIVYEYGYCGGVMAESFDIDTAMSIEYNGLIEFITDNAPSDRLTQFLLARYVYHNIKEWYKAKLAPIKSLNYNVANEYLQAVNEGTYNDLPDNLADSLFECDRLHLENKLTPNIIDYLITRAMYNDMARLAKGFPLAVRLLTCEIDLVNIRTIIRGKKLDVPVADCLGQTYEGGRVDSYELSRLYESGDVMGMLSTFDYDLGAGDDGLELLDNGIDSYLASVSRHGVSILNESAFISYIYCEHYNLKRIRLLLVAHKNNIEPLKILKDLGDII